MIFSSKKAALKEVMSDLRCAENGDGFMVAVWHVVGDELGCSKTVYEFPSDKLEAAVALLFESNEDEDDHIRLEEESSER